MQPDSKELKEISAKILEASMARLKSDRNTGSQLNADKVFDIPNKRVNEGNRFFIGRSSGRRLIDPQVQPSRQAQSTRKLPSTNVIQSLMSIPEPDNLHSGASRYRNQCSAKEIDGLNRFTKGRKQSAMKRNFFASNFELN